MPHGTFAVSGTGKTPVANSAQYPISNGESNKCEFFKFLANNKQVTIHSAENFSARIDWPIANYGLSANGNESRLVCYLVGVFYTAL
jgi:hypothetical protein